MITYLEEPLRATHKTTGDDLLVLAFMDGPRIIFVGSNGDLGTAGPSEVNLNWRFNYRTRKWVDVDTGEEFEESDGEK